MKYSDVSVTPLLGNKYKLLKPLTYKDVTVPAGYRTNGADIPRIFWFLLPPNKSDYLPAVIVHDYICDLEDYVKADKYFDEILRDLNVNKTDRKRLVVSVKLYHKIKYGTPYYPTAD